MFFELGTPGDMLQKARRELRRLEDDVSIDNVFNFFVTAWQITEYLDEPLRDEARNDPLILHCGDAGNKAKHMKLTRRPDPKTPKHYHVFIGGTESDFVIWNIEWPNGTSREVVSFAREVVEKWEQFFASHGISADGAS